MRARKPGCAIARLDQVQEIRKFLLTQQGVPASTITARGFGKTQPVVTNDTPEGRQRNRRVEIVVNGEAIGNGAASPRASSQ